MKSTGLFSFGLRDEFSLGDALQGGHGSTGRSLLQSAKNRHPVRVATPQNGVESHGRLCFFTSFIHCLDLLKCTCCASILIFEGIIFPPSQRISPQTIICSIAINCCMLLVVHFNVV
ncbi:hypothetical protein KSP40_PGU010000 [Platanthera guangdongensis]|uniref:Uncharacterized protein n=1 Tax=Platanthera guangdongensis TaxID=2320717 RepID=A0ABR2N0T4_9ASPA